MTFAAGGALGRLGFSSSDCTGDAQFLVKRLHPDDREQFLALLRAVASDGKERQIEHRMVSADGQRALVPHRAPRGAVGVSACSAS